jgi:hypothetical protein
MWNSQEARVSSHFPEARSRYSAWASVWSAAAGLERAAPAHSPDEFGRAAFDGKVGEQDQLPVDNERLGVPPCFAKRTPQAHKRGAPHVCVGGTGQRVIDRDGLRQVGLGELRPLPGPEHTIARGFRRWCDRVEGQAPGRCRPRGAGVSDNEHRASERHFARCGQGAIETVEAALEHPDGPVGRHFEPGTRPLGFDQLLLIDEEPPEPRQAGHGRDGASQV